MIGRIIAASLIGTLANCCPLPAKSADEIRPAQIITVGEDYEFRFDARHGDTVNVVMNPTGDFVARCNSMGGDAELIWNPFTEIATCEKVDF